MLVYNKQLVDVTKDRVNRVAGIRYLRWKVARQVWRICNVCTRLTNTRVINDSQWLLHCLKFAALISVCVFTSVWLFVILCVVYRKYTSHALDIPEAICGRRSQPDGRVWTGWSRLKQIMTITAYCLVDKPDQWLPVCQVCLNAQQLIRHELKHLYKIMSCID
jgi:hypothetical protein